MHNNHCNSRFAILTILLGWVFLSTAHAQITIPAALSEESEACITQPCAGDLRDLQGVGRFQTFPGQCGLLRVPSNQEN